MTKILKLNDTVTLSSLSETPITQLVIGAAWTGKPKTLIQKVLKKERPVDLDFSCIMYDDDGQTQDTVWYANLHSRDGAVTHNGDDTTGEDDGIDEAITLNMNAIPDEVHSIMFVISSFSGETIRACSECEVRIQNAGLTEPMAIYNIKTTDGHDDKTAVLMIFMKREGGDWVIRASGKSFAAKNIQDIYGPLRRELNAAA